MARQPFPGNVRELENVLERAVVFTGGGDLAAADLALRPSPATMAAVPAADPGAMPPAAAAHGTTPADELAERARIEVVDGVPSDLAAYLDEVEGAAIRAALAKTRHNRTAAAELLGISFRQMRYRMQRLGLK
jgi:Transcriptional regulator containing PAS, AAA-type ATPase, and DNA-binding domains